MTVFSTYVRSGTSKTMRTHSNSEIKTMAYTHSEFETKWQKRWEDEHLFHAEFPSQKPKYYALDMFPYPSGSGLHVGHLASYLPSDITSRYKRAKGFNVLHPMGFDAFGLPAEQYAIQTGVHPEITTKKAVDNFERQLKSFGFSFDWTKKLATTDPDYMKWTQYIFGLLFKEGLAYQKEVPVNWCPALKTVLANEEVVDGKSERGGHPVERVPMKQWMLKITDYAEELLSDLETIAWPDRTKEGQRNWIGKSTGAQVSFEIEDHSSQKFEVFTTRPDTLYGVTFMVIAPEHPLAMEISTPEQIKAVEDYITAAKSKSELARKANTEKTGVFTGAHCIHPLTDQPIPIWISDYVLMDYGTGAIMAVPAHDERDFEFAQVFNLPVQRVLDGGELPYLGEGTLVNSDFLNGLSKTEAIEKTINHLESKNLGTRQTQYKLRDWLFSRQRYWGEPIPVIHTSEGSKIVELKDLPVTLPEVSEYEPSDSGEAPLARNTEWVNTPAGKRDTDTMPGSAGSSWYFLRYPDPDNTEEICSKEKQDYWLPVDLYVGGPEHTVGHLLYSRFWTKFLKNKGVVSINEPFNKLAHQGMVLGPDGEKMSKSRGNVINPDEYRETHGADAVRVYISFMGPFERDKPWSTQGIEGSRRFLDRVWRLCLDDEGKSLVDDSNPSESLNKGMHRAIKKVTEDIENMSFNTAVSAMMILVNELYKAESRPRTVISNLLKILHPFAPHLTEELWNKTGNENILGFEKWPSFDPELCQDNALDIGVQVNGKMRGSIQVTLETPEEEAVEAAKQLKPVATQLEGKKIFKVIYKSGKILNIIAK